MAKKQLLNLRFGNKAIIFTIDAMAGLFIVLTILTVSYFYMFKSVNELPDLTILRTGDDIITIMDYDGTLDSLNANLIKNQTYTLLPNRYDMLINITSSNQDVISIGNPIPNDRFVASGKRFSVIANQNNATYITTRFWIWLK